MEWHKVVLCLVQRHKCMCNIHLGCLRQNLFHALLFHCSFIQISKWILKTKIYRENILGNCKCIHKYNNLYTEPNIWFIFRIHCYGFSWDLNFSSFWQSFDQMKCTLNIHAQNMCVFVCVRAIVIDTMPLECIQSNFHHCSHWNDERCFEYMWHFFLMFIHCRWHILQMKEK